MIFAIHKFPLLATFITLLTFTTRIDEFHPKSSRRQFKICHKQWLLHCGFCVVLPPMLLDRLFSKTKNPHVTDFFLIYQNKRTACNTNMFTMFCEGSWVSNSSHILLAYYDEQESFTEIHVCRRD